MRAFDKIKNFLITANSSNFLKNLGSKNINRYLAPVQFFKIRQDIQGWRDGQVEAENPILPFRVKMQRLYADTILNTHVSACISKRKNLLLLKDFALYNGENIDIKATELLKQKFFYDIMNYTLDADLFGYSLISLGDIDGSKVSDISLVKRENVSPDRLNVAQVIYSPQGIINFMDTSCVNDEGQSFYDWSIYISTQNQTAQSKCGYGLLYKIAYLEIFLRNITGFNADYAEVYGQPLKHAKSNKLEGAEYDNLETALKNMASNPYLITDHETDIEFVSATGAGTGHQVYADLEARLEKKITKELLGHADALDSTPGKLGANTEIEKAIRDIETVQVRQFEHEANNNIIPKLINLGIPIPNGLVFRFKNDKEKLEIKTAKDASDLNIATIAKTLKDAGLSMDAAYFTEVTGIPVKEVEIDTPSFNASVKNSLDILYGDA